MALSLEEIFMNKTCIFSNFENIVLKIFLFDPKTIISRPCIRGLKFYFNLG